MIAHAEPAAGGGEPPETVLAVISSHGEQEMLLVEREGRRLCRLRGTTHAERARLQQIALLLRALDEDGVRAVPRLVGEDRAGLLLERHAPLRLGGGRRRAQPEEATPPTLERHASLDAREDLEALVSSLHARGWVVGLAPGAGLGARPDGSVVISDLRTLRPEGSVGARMQDQHWLDSVLEDQGRTLRRRVDMLPGRPAEPTTGEPSPGDPTSAGSPSSPELAPPPAWSVGWRARLSRGSGTGTGTDPTEALASDEGILGAEPSERADRSSEARPARAHRAARARAVLPRRSGTRWSAPRRGIVLAAAASVLVLGGGATAIAAALAHHERPAPAESATSASPAADPKVAADPDDPADPEVAADPAAASPAATWGIDDPQALVQELALGRHRYVTGESGTSVCAQGSPAAAQDEALRGAYRDVEVEGEGPVVTSARIEHLDEEKGTARLRAVLDQGELRLTTGDGAVVVRPAAGEQEVVLELVREDGSWRVHAAGPAEA